jgi:redox-sensitive bicupin YhaK (pirin superfamily)
MIPTPTDGRDGSVSMNQDALLYAGLFEADERARLEMAPRRKGYVHVARGKAAVNGHTLNAGDALKTNGGTIEIGDGQAAEVLVFDLPGE